MNCKQEAARLLKDYAAMQAACDNLTEQIRLLAAEACMICSSGKPVNVVRGGDSREDWLLTNLTKRQELQRRLQQARRWLQVADRALATLNREDRALLQSFFMDAQRQTVQQLCQTMNLERSSAYRKRDRALEQFTKALYGSAEGGSCA